MNLLTTDEVAKILRFESKDSIHQMLHSGTLPKELTVKIGRKRLFIKEKLEEFIEKKVGV